MIELERDPTERLVALPSVVVPKAGYPYAATVCHLAHVEVSTRINRRASVQFAARFQLISPIGSSD